MISKNINKLDYTNYKVNYVSKVVHNSVLLVNEKRKHNFIDYCCQTNHPELFKGLFLTILTTNDGLTNL